MTLNAKVQVHGHPDLKFGVTSGPIGFELRCDGALKVGVGPIHARIDRIPVFVRIPFLKRAAAGIAAAAVGPFTVRLDAFSADVRAVEATARGRIGTDGLRAEVDGKGACRLDIDVAAEVPAKAVGAAIQSALQQE